MTALEKTKQKMLFNSSKEKQEKEKEDAAYEKEVRR